MARSKFTRSINLSGKSEKIIRKIRPMQRCRNMKKNEEGSESKGEVEGGGEKRDGVTWPCFGKHNQRFGLESAWMFVELVL